MWSTTTTLASPRAVVLRVELRVHSSSVRASPSRAGGHRQAGMNGPGIHDVKYRLRNLLRDHGFEVLRVVAAVE